MSEFAGLSDVQPWSTNFITGEIFKIDDEHGEVTLRQGPIAHVHLSARTTILHYVLAKVIFGSRQTTRLGFGRIVRMTEILLPYWVCPDLSGGGTIKSNFRKME